RRGCSSPHPEAEAEPRTRFKRAAAPISLGLRQRAVPRPFAPGLNWTVVLSYLVEDGRFPGRLQDGRLCLFPAADDRRFFRKHFGIIAQQNFPPLRVFVEPGCLFAFRWSRNIARIARDS